MIEIMKASAGSGKTYSLARKYISLLLGNKDRYAYRHILAVTFTNKATDEMKGRILKELHVLAKDPSRSGYHDYFVPSLFPSDAEISAKAEAVLHDILHDYSAFSVSTIDRFFQQTLKAFSREIGQFASYQVELDKESLVAESVDRILDSLTEEDGSLLAWLTENVLEQIEQGGRYSMDANLLEMAGRLKSSQRRDALIAAGLDAGYVVSKDKLADIRQECRGLISGFREKVRENARKALDVLLQAGVDPSESTRGFMTALYGYAEISDNDTVAAPTDAFMRNAADYEKWFAKSKAKNLLPKVYPFLEAPLEDFCALFGTEFSVYNTALILDGQLYGLGVAGELESTFKELMKEKNVLCIDDSNDILRDIINGSDAPFIYEKTGVRYDHFLLDEFQDTASVQWQNFRPLLRESESKGGSNLIVGDVKQSIYRWRGSDWKLLQDIIPEEFPDHVHKVLDTNFRSLPCIVTFNNRFFSEASFLLDTMSGHPEDKPVSEIYSDVRQKVSMTGRGEGSVSLTFCDKEDELAKVLDCINEIRGVGAGLSEIAILVRSNAIGEVVSSFLIENGISVMTDDSLRVKSSITVRRLVSLMSYADSPEDTVNGFLADSLDITVPEKNDSLIDMAESLYRSICNSDTEGIWKGEILHIQSFFDHLMDYVSMEGNDLRGFLCHWEDANPSISSPSSGDCVRVMTIHKSKGLAFPYVIVPFIENITLYKPGKNWCSPTLAGTSLEGVADGVYDVLLSKSSERTMFAEDYRRENFMQTVDNLNTMYVAMTRPSLGMHLIAKMPSAKCLNAIENDGIPQFSDFSHILYWFAHASVMSGDIAKAVGEDYVRFDAGEIADFEALRKHDDSYVEDYDIRPGEEFVSIPLNPEDGDDDVDVRERGRLKYSADSVDFFSDDGKAGISASNRIKGVVLHEILSNIKSADEFEKAAQDALEAGEVTYDEYLETVSLLQARLASARSRGWFADDVGKVLNEVSLIDSDGAVYRPDRVEINGSKVLIIDYKFGEHNRKYEHQLKRYAGIWRRMGYEDVSAVLWYVQDDMVMEVE